MDRYDGPTICNKSAKIHKHYIDYKISNNKQYNKNKNKLKYKYKHIVKVPTDKRKTYSKWTFKAHLCVILNVSLRIAG